MNLRFNIVLAALLAFIPFAVSAALADAGQPAATIAAEVPAQAAPACPQPLDKKLNMAQTTQTECCKDHKGVCGCRAGKIVCCDGTVSTKPGCTCHGDDGFLE